MTTPEGSRESVSRQARLAVQKAASMGLSQYRLSKLSGVSASALCRLLQGGTASTATLDRLAPYLGLRLEWDAGAMLKAAKAKKGGR